MKNFSSKLNLIFKVLSIVITFLFVTSCGNFFRYTPTKDVPTKGEERAKKNIEQGKGVTIRGLGGGGNTTYEFSTSNPLWRATLETIDFIPLSSVNYSGGIVITDWYNSGNTDESLKITIRFLSNEITSSSLKIIVHQRICKSLNDCSINELNSSIKNELNLAILNKAKIFEEESKKIKK
jgi:hypothetical protein